MKHFTYHHGRENGLVRAWTCPIAHVRVEGMQRRVGVRRGARSPAGGTRTRG